MIVTVTLNPALDKTGELNALCVGELNRLTNITTDVGGKGINVSKMINALGGSSVATGFIGGSIGKQISDTISEMGIKSDFVTVDGTTRTNLKVLDNGTRLTELNEPGIKVSEKEVEKLINKINRLCNSNTIFVLSGSLCQGVDHDFYGKIIQTIHKNGGLAYLDADGSAFKSALEQKPDFIKPNSHELLEYYNISHEVSNKDLVDLCYELMEKGIPRMALSMGKDGAIFIDHKNSFYAPGLKVDAHSAVGAGDSMMGAIAFGADSKMSWEQTAKLAVASSAGAVTTIGTKPPSKEFVDTLIKQVKFENI